MYVKTDEDGRITATTEFEEYAEGMEAFDFPDGFDFDEQSEWRVDDGELVHDPVPESVEETINRLKAQLAATDYVVIKIAEANVTGASIPDEDASRYASIMAQRAEWRAMINGLEAK